MDDKEFDYINVIPLVDVMLVLLTIVLTTSTLIAAGAIPLSLPRATQRESTPAVRTIEIDKTGTIHLDAAPICISKLKEELAPVDKNVPMLIRADKDVLLQRFVDVLDAIKQLGFARVSLQTESAP